MTQPDNDHDTTYEPTDEDDSVLLTETEPGSVLPPEDDTDDDVEETDDLDESDLAEVPEPTDELDEPEDEDDVADTDDLDDVEPTDDFERAAVTAVPSADEVAEPTPMERLEPVEAGAPIDPGTGSVADRWTTIQAAFIDDPRRSVESASALVAQLWQDIERAIAIQQRTLEDSWQAGERSTDDLRLAMQEYRALYTRFVDFTP